jgi:hypothetical protein
MNSCTSLLPIEEAGDEGIATSGCQGKKPAQVKEENWI